MYALVVAGFLTTAGFAAEIVALFGTQEQCEATKTEVSVKDMSEVVVAAGLACILLEEK